MRQWARRLSASALGAVLALLPLGLLEATWARADQPLSLLRLWLASVGLLAPLALAIGAATGVASLLLHPAAPPCLRRGLRWFRASDGSGAALLAASLSAILFVILGAQGALHVLASGAGPAASGAALGLGALGLGLALTVLAAAGARLLRPRLRRADPVLPGAAGLLLIVAVLGFAIATGTTSGDGGPLSLFGVLKRPELDLRAPALLLACALVAYLLPVLLVRLPLAAAFGLAIAALSFTPAASAVLAERQLALAVERGAPLSKLLLSPLRRLSDRDGDGFSARFGGGDCDDTRADVNPGAEDVPGNGVDEDCSGRDAQVVELEEPAAAPPKDLKAFIQSKLPERPNVLLITIDTLRFDLGYMGNPRPVSPNIDRLAAESAVFERAYALASYTSKSLAPMMIGKYTSETHRGWAHFNRFGKQDTFVQERLQQAGIRTISVQGYWYFFNPGYGFERGFDVIDASAAPKVAQIEGDRTFNSHKLTDAAIAQLKADENREQPFFMWVHYVDPHSEYVRHEAFDFGPGSRDRYDSEVAFVDQQVGRLIDAVRAQPFGPRTAVVLTSDHGEAFGEHGMIRHGFELWEELVRVPLLVHVPEAAPQRIAEPRSIIDVVPTILEIFGLPEPAGEGTDFVSGRSLLPDVLSPPGHEPGERLVFVDMSAGPYNAERQAFIDGHLKLIASEGRPLGLYDLKQDPEEKQDLLENAELKETMLGRFKAFRNKLREVRVRPQ
ncbi:MAG TPA: sulfatase-like hydrolase/transferase [Polyangiaceae bacterium]|nr:sulfatase-like hydrolase/transferase [Polyangiaceae bacterium]